MEEQDGYQRQKLKGLPKRVDWTERKQKELARQKKVREQLDRLKKK